MWLDADVPDGQALNDPVLLVSVSTSMPQYRAMYSQARELAEYMLRKMEFVRVGSVRSSAFPPEVIVRADGATSLPQCTFHVYRGKRDLLLFSGDTSPADDQFEFSEALVGWAKRMGVTELYSVGARWTESPGPPEADPEVWGFSTDAAGVDKLKSQGVKIISEEPAPFFASLVVALAGASGLTGYKLSVNHGEPSPHPKSVARILRVLSGALGFEVDLRELTERARGLTSKGKGNGSVYQ